MTTLNEWARGRDLRPLTDEQIERVILELQIHAHAANSTNIRWIGLLLGEVARLRRENEDLRDAGTYLLRRMRDTCESGRDEE